MPDPQTTRYRAVALIVVGLLVVLGILLAVALLLGGDQTDQVDPQNDDDASSAPALLASRR